ncbi:MAG: hypothetical protein F4Y98_00785 [Chloroflexi bacterium]|nr:hypothetical protein [Chloroflexota bacterium]
MTEFWTPDRRYRRIEYTDEADLERAILDTKEHLFGEGRIYLDEKRKIGTRGGQRNIPDGYLIDIRGSQPHLYVVENELERHDALRHIAVQVLEFSLAFESNPLLVKSILMETLSARPAELQRCEAYVQGHTEYRNVDHLLESLVVSVGFRALVIIDDIPERLETVLQERLRFPVEILSLAPYEDEEGARAYQFEPFLADVVPPSVEAAATDHREIDPADIDTIVVPARPEGFEQVFIGEDRWHEIRISPSMRDQIRWIAAYQVAPISAITHIAPVRSIEPWEDSGKYVVNFAEPARGIGPIAIVGDGRVSGLQGPRYTTKSRVDEARNIFDLWPAQAPTRHPAGGLATHTDGPSGGAPP